MLLIQVSLLKIFGLLPPSREGYSQDFGTKTVSRLMPLIAICFLIGTLFSSCLQGAVFFYAALYPETDGPTSSTTNLLYVLQIMPFFIVNSRAFFGIFLIFIKRHDWKNLMQETNDFMRICLTQSARNILLEKIRFFSVSLFLVTFILHLSWESSAWLNFIVGSPNISMMSENAYPPLPIKEYTYQFVIIWTIFCSVPFLLSQQVYLCLIILAMILSEAMKKLDDEIQEEVEYYMGSKGGSVIFKKKETNLSEEKVKQWEVCHMRMLLFCQSLNRFFNLILFFIYGLDFVALLGFISNIVQNYRSDAISYAFLIFSSLLFLSYQTVFLLPLVAVHEKV
jgi:hypothetical protein